MAESQILIPTDTWIKATWQDYQAAIARAEYAQAKGYFSNARMRLEMSPLGNPHSRDHFIVMAAIALYVGLKELDCRKHSDSGLCHG